MILDILYWHKSPEQIQGVRLTTVYPHSDVSKEHELVIHFVEVKPTRWINLSEVQSITITND